MSDLRGHLQWQQGEFRLDTGPFAIPLDGVTAIFGRSGAGKSTLLRVISGLERGAQGELHCGPAPWLQPGLIVPARRRRVGMVFQKPALFPHLTVRGNLEYALRRVVSHAVSHDAAATPTLSLPEVVARVGLERQLDAPVTHLSGGEQQRVALARAVLSRPQLLCMDEPLSNLDWDARDALLDLIEQLAHDSRVPVLYVTHAPREVERIAQRVLFMDAGRVTGLDDLQTALSRADSVLFAEDGAMTVWEGRFQADAAADDGAGVFVTQGGAQLHVACGSVSVSPMTAPRLRIRASDVSLARERVRGISIQNQLLARIAALEAVRPGRVTVRLRTTTDEPLFAEVTPRAVAQLDLRVGEVVHALIKAVALMR